MNGYHARNRVFVAFACLGLLITVADLRVKAGNCKIDPSLSCLRPGSLCDAELYCTNSPYPAQITDGMGGTTTVYVYGEKSTGTMAGTCDDGQLSCTTCNPAGNCSTTYYDEDQYGNCTIPVGGITKPVVGCTDFH